MDVSCPSLPPKILVRNETDAELRPNEQTTAYMAAHGCHLAIGSLCVLLAIIESILLAVRDGGIARTLLYKSNNRDRVKIFSMKNNRRRFDTVRLLGGRPTFNKRIYRVG
jgi:hypothetical protein